MSKRPSDWFVVRFAAIAALGGAALLPLRAEAATHLRWRQSGSGAQGYVIYFGSVSGVYTGYRDIGYVTPDSNGISSYPLQGLITTDSFMAMTAYNAAGTSALSNELFVTAACSSDADCAISQQCRVGVCDAQLGCGSQNVPDGTSCDDGDANTMGDYCAAGQCVNSSPPGVGGTVSITQIVPGMASGVVGMPATFLVSATSTGTPLFRWVVMAPSSGNWAIVQDHSPNPLLSWTPQMPGTYRIGVSAKTEGAAAEQDWEAVAFEVAAPPSAVSSSAVALAVADPDPMDLVPMFVPIALEAMGGAGLEYRFSVFHAGRPWRVLRNYSSDPRLVWLPVYRPGTYELGVEVRNSGESKPWGVDTASVQIVAAPLLECSASAGAVSCNTPAAGGELEYQWWVMGPRTRWQVLHAFGEMGESVSFTPSSGPGTYWVGVWARPAAGSPLGTRLIYARSVALRY